MRKFARRWFGPYPVTSANDNDTYNLAEVDGTRISVPVARKRIKDEPDLEGVDDGDDRIRADGNSENQR